MFNVNKSTSQPIIVKGGKHHEDDHGNHSWKIAYADFTTAMMAFFLVMWLIAVTSQSQRDGLADFFNPVSISQSHSGADGVLSGRSVDEDGSLISPSASGLRAVPVSSPPVESQIGTQERAPFLVGQIGDPIQGGMADGAGEDALSEEDGPSGWDGSSLNEDGTLRVRSGQGDRRGGVDGDGRGRGASDAPGQGDLQTIAGAVQAIYADIAGDPDLASLLGAIDVAVTPIGVEIQIQDQDYFAMFPRGGTTLEPRALALIAEIAQGLEGIPNQVSITGHTDATTYPAGASYSNWELSADRANAARRALIANGVTVDRVSRVEGLAATKPLVDDPEDPRNRRVVFTVLSQPGASPAFEASVGEGAQAPDALDLFDPQ